MAVYKKKRCFWIEWKKTEPVSLGGACTMASPDENHERSQFQKVERKEHERKASARRKVDPEYKKISPQELNSTLSRGTYPWTWLVALADCYLVVGNSSFTKIWSTFQVKTWNKWVCNDQMLNHSGFSFEVPGKQKMLHLMEQNAGRYDEISFCVGWLCS